MYLTEIKNDWPPFGSDMKTDNANRLADPYIYAGFKAFN